MVRNHSEPSGRVGPKSCNFVLNTVYIITGIPELMSVLLETWVLDTKAVPQHLLYVEGRKARRMN
jgi:hypothetical protein